MKNGWIGVGLDGTLAEDNGLPALMYIGAPVPRMAERVRDWLELGLDVRIVTPRVSYHPGSPEQVLNATYERDAIYQWTEQHFGRQLPVTCMVDPGMVELWDCRNVSVQPNTGRRLDR